MIVTLTPNPSIDRTVHLPRLKRSAVNRVDRSMVEPSGKGINVALALHSAGLPTVAVFPVGGGTGQQLAELLALTGLPTRAVGIGGQVRVNLSIIEADGTSTKVNEPGPAMTEMEVDALSTAALDCCNRGDWLQLGGSLPPGFRPDKLTDLVVSARDAGVLVALDSSGESLRAGAASAQLVKPNAQELAELIGQPISTLGDAAEAARVLLGWGVRTVLVSLGGDGALLVDETTALHGRARVARVVNTVGAGDAFLAGYLSTVLGSVPPAERLATALRWGAAAVQQEGTLFPVPDQSLTLEVGPIEVDRRLEEPAS